MITNIAFYNTPQKDYFEDLLIRDLEEEVLIVCEDIDTKNKVANAIIDEYIIYSNTLNNAESRIEVMNNKVRTTILFVDNEQLITISCDKAFNCHSVWGAKKNQDGKIILKKFLTKEK